MGIFSKLFGKQQPSLPPFEMAPTAGLMDEDKYWQMVAESVELCGSGQSCQEKYLIGALENLPPGEIVGFRLRTDKLLYDTYSSEMWCAGYIMNGGCSDDGFEYFRLWVISRGREVYENAKADPDSLVAVADVSVPEGLFDFESFWYVALKAFENKTGKEPYDFIDYENFKFGEGNYQQFDFTWTEEDAESRKKICPKLFAQFEEA